MANEFKGLAHHSAEYFGDAREHWWHDDFIALLGHRWRLADVGAVLDVGCGVGHWSRVLARAAPLAARFVGIDREERWIEEATRRTAAAGLADRFEYRAGVAEALPFDSGSFDLVTCQTLLIHVPDPSRVLAEMVRVTRPGGLVVVAEPTNIAPLLVASIALHDAPEITAAGVHFQLVCERGKSALGEGNNLLGEALPSLLVSAGLESVELRQNDHAWPMAPPYSSPPERAQADDALDAAERNLGIWDEATTRRYFVAGGGDAGTFSRSWELALEQQRRVAAAIAAGTYSCAGGTLFYVAWGRRPRP
jgi:SAM-dependent methyltransferase